MTEDEMAGWHHQLDGHKSLSELQEMVMNREAGDEQGGLACCDSWGGKESDSTE